MNAQREKSLLYLVWINISITSVLFLSCKDSNSGPVLSREVRLSQALAHYDSCYAMQNSYHMEGSLSCIEAAVNRQLRIDRDVVTVIPGGLSLTGPGDRNFLLRYQEGIDLQRIVYTYRCYFHQQGYFLIKAQYHEDGRYGLVNDRTGELAFIKGFPHISPDGKYMLTINADLGAKYEFNGLEIIDLNGEKPKIIWERELLHYLPTGARWLDDHTAILNLVPPEWDETRSPIQVKLLQESGTWLLEGADQAEY